MMLKVAPARLRPGGLFHARETAMIATLALILCFVAALILLIPPPDFWWRGLREEAQPSLQPKWMEGLSEPSPLHRPAGGPPPHRLRRQGGLDRPRLSSLRARHDGRGTMRSMVEGPRS